MSTPDFDHAADSSPRLARVVGVGGAVLLGMGSILGTGLFVGLGVAAGVAGDALVPAVLLAACLAACNGLSSAALAARHPVSGGAYEYGYRLLTPTIGFVAGTTFLIAKSASAATAALGLAAAVLGLLSLSGQAAHLVLAEIFVVLLVGLAAAGLRRSNRVNALLVGLVMAGLAALVVLGLPRALASFEPGRTASAMGDWPSLLRATALCFVAYTGYGRVATLGEEIRDPARNVPRAISITLVVTAVLYALVSFVALGVAGAEGLAGAAADGRVPLVEAGRLLGTPGLAAALAAAALIAMVGVLLNLVLGLSRVALAMARRGDLPRGLATLHASSPRRAVLLVGAGIAALVLLGDVRTTWSLSAFTVLVYYATTNLAALCLPRAERRLPTWVPALGLVGCLGLAAFVEPRTLLAGSAVVVLAALGHASFRRFARN